MPLDNTHYNPWSLWLSSQEPGRFAHPNAPVGGAGLGVAQEYGAGEDPSWWGVPHPNSPAGRHVTPDEAATGYLSFEFEKARERVRSSSSWVRLREAAVLVLGPQSFGLGVGYGFVKNPVVSLGELIQLQKLFIEADLYDRLTHQTPWWKQLLLGAAIINPLGAYLVTAQVEAGKISFGDLKRAYETREALIKEVGELFANPGDFFKELAEQTKKNYVEKWQQFCNLQLKTDLKSRFEAGEIFGDVLMDMVMLALTVVGAVGAVRQAAAQAAKLAARFPQLTRVAEYIRSLRSAKAGAVAEEGAEVAKAAEGVKPSVVVEEPPVRNWKYAKKQSGRTEPGAIPETADLRAAMLDANSRKAPVTPKGWPEMPIDGAQTFAAEPRPVEYPPGTKLYRIIDNDKSASGSYWTTEHPPQSEAAWRAGSAIKDKWNGDGGYVEKTVGPGGLKAWEGPTAAQEAATKGMVLPGGKTQTWVPAGTLAPSSPPQPTPWNRR